MRRLASKYFFELSSSSPMKNRWKSSGHPLNFAISGLHRLLERCEELPLRLPHLAEHLLNLLERAHRRRERIDRKRVHGALAVVVHQRMHDQLVHGHVRAVESGELLRNLAERHRVKALAVVLALD